MKFHHWFWGMLSLAFFIPQLPGQTAKPAASLKVVKAPTFSALSADGQRLFVTGFAEEEDNIEVVDVAGHKTISRFYGGFEPLGIVASPVGDKIFITNFTNGVVMVIDARTFAILDDIKVGGQPSNVTVSPKGLQVFVTNYGRGKVGKIDFIDTSSHRILAQIDVGIRPLDAIVSPLGDRLFVVCAGSNDLYVLDVDRREVLKTIPVGQAPDGIALSADGLTLYVANSGTNDISIIDLLDLRETRRAPVGQRPFSLAVAPDGRIFVVETADQMVSVYDADFQRLQSFKAGKKPVDVLLSSDAGYAFVTDEKDNRILIFKVPEN